MSHNLQSVPDNVLEERMNKFWAQQLKTIQCMLDPQVFILISVSLVWNVPNYHPPFSKFCRVFNCCLVFGFLGPATELKDFKQHLPLARIKKIMKSDDDLRAQMISSEVPHLFAKACELFVLDLTLRSWLHTDANRRRTLQVGDR